jgi:hypothetical protein
METIRINLNNEHSVGLGDNLCLLSALANVEPAIDLYVDNNHNTFDRLTHYKKIFKIPDDRLKIFLSEENGNFNNVGWPVKFFSDYYKPKYVNVLGQNINLERKQEKKCIAIAASYDLRTDDVTRWPYCRARSIKYWSKIFETVKKAGYEVITVDHPFHDLESKIEMMTKHCEAIISYEGGMAHLAHMIGLPCFLVDWKIPSPSTNLDNFHCEFVHKSNSVYILRDDREILGWGEDEFRNNINKLRAGGTNNRLVNGQCKTIFGGPGIHGRISIIDTASNKEIKNVDGIFGDSVHADFLSKFYTK